MAIYGLSIREIVQSFHDALEDVEGDFSKKDLHEALKIMKNYPWVSDLTSQEDAEKWGDYLIGEDNIFECSSKPSNQTGEKKG